LKGLISRSVWCILIFFYECMFIRAINLILISFFSLVVELQLTNRQGCHQFREIRECYFQSENIREKERCFEKSRRMREDLSVVLLHLRAMTFSLLNHTSSWVWQSPNFTLSYIILFYIRKPLLRTILCLMKRKLFKWTELVSKHS